MIVNPLRVQQALALAFKAHDGQLRDGEQQLPYITHPLTVALMVAELNVDEDVIIAAILHDTVEDSLITTEYLEENFGSRVASIVAEVTENAHLSYFERKALVRKNAQTFSLDALVIKSADLIHNSSDLITSMNKGFNGNEPSPKLQRLKHYYQLSEILLSRLSNSPLYYKLHKCHVGLRHLLDRVDGNQI